MAKKKKMKRRKERNKVGRSDSRCGQAAVFRCTCLLKQKSCSSACSVVKVLVSLKGDLPCFLTGSMQTGRAGAVGPTSRARVLAYWFFLPAVASSWNYSNPSSFHFLHRQNSLSTLIQWILPGFLWYPSTVLSTVGRMVNETNVVLDRMECVCVCVCARACAPTKSFQSCPTLCNPMDCSSPGSFVHGILQARMLERVAMLSSRGSSQPRDQACIS